LCLRGGENEKDKKFSIDQSIEHLWYANIEDEANVTLHWWEWDRREIVTALMEWKGAIKKRTGL